MSRGRPKQSLNLTDETKMQLENISNSRSLPHSQVRRAKIILMSDQGLTNTAIAKIAARISKYSSEPWAFIIKNTLNQYKFFTS